MPTEIKGVDTNPPKSQPMTLGRKEVAGSRTETIRPHQRPGREVAGTPSGAERTDASAQRYSDGASYRAGLRDSRR
jgi:hypothetical protein